MILTSFESAHSAQKTNTLKIEALRSLVKSV